MIIVHVQVHVLPDFIDAFKLATIENARNSVREAGIARFDVIQQENDPSRFLLCEVYRTAEASSAHKQTAHYTKWKDTVQSMMSEPRSSIKYYAVFPEEANL